MMLKSEGFRVSRASFTFGNGCSRYRIDHLHGHIPLVRSPHGQMMVFRRQCHHLKPIRGATGLFMEELPPKRKSERGQGKRERVIRMAVS